MCGYVLDSSDSVEGRATGLYVECNGKLGLVKCKEIPDYLENYGLSGSIMLTGYI
jgi:hypothetical protein